MKIASENAAIALTQTNPVGTGQKRRASEAEAVKVKTAENARAIVDTVELSEPKPAAQVSRTDAQIPQAAAQSKSGAAPDPLADLVKSFGLRTGDQGFNSAQDVNGDGVINFADLNASLNKNTEPPTGGPSPAEIPQSASAASIIDQPADVALPGAPDASEPPTGGPLPVEPDPAASSPASLTGDADEIAPGASEVSGPSQAGEGEGPASFNAEDIGRLLDIFGAADGSERFNSAYDFDNDGVINFGDLSELLNRIGGEAGAPGAPGAQQQSLLDHLTERFGATEGDDVFNPGLDFDNDGVINFGDLNTLLANLAQSRSAND